MFLAILKIAADSISATQLLISHDILDTVIESVKSTVKKDAVIALFILIHTGTPESILEMMRIK